MTDRTPPTPAFPSTASLQTAEPPGSGLHWRRERVELPFKLGPFALARVGLDVCTCAHPPCPPVASVQELAALLPPIPERADGLWLYALPTAQPLPRRMRLNGTLGYVLLQTPHHVIDLSLGAAAYWARLSSNTRSQLRRKTKALQTHSGGRIDWQCFRRPEEMAAFEAQARPVSLQSYQHKLFRAGLPEGPQWLAHLHERAAAGAVWAFVLRLHGQPIAYLYLEAAGQTLTYAYLGHLAEHAAWSPGTVLFGLALEEVLQHSGCRWLDFGSGEGQHKQSFATGQVLKAQVFVLRDTARHRLLLASHAALQTTSDTLTRLARRSGLHARLKSWLRRRSTAA